MSSGIASQRAWLGLGGNIGDVRQAMADALRSLDAVDEIAVEQVSSVYKTPPWGLEDQPWFLNCCAGISCSLTPEQLLEACQQVDPNNPMIHTNTWNYLVEKVAPYAGKKVQQRKHFFMYVKGVTNNEVE